MLRRLPKPGPIFWLCAACVFWFLILAGKPAFTNASRPPRFGDPQLSLQFVRNLEDVDAILGDAPSPDREVMRIKQYIDFAFIASYASLFIALSLRGWQAGGWRRTVGIAAMLCGIAAAIFDVVENIAILRILDIPLYLTGPGMLDAIRRAAIAKWLLAGISLPLSIVGAIRLSVSRGTAQR